ncbi:MAG: hypothetical protein RRZ66_04955 [Bacteroidales bacterium]
MYLYYKIADHVLAIKTQCPEMIDGLLPSFQPFRHIAEKPSDILFTLSVNHSLAQHGEEMRSFSWEGSMCSMYRTERGYFVTLTDLQLGTTEMMESFDNWQTIHTSVSPQEDASGYFLNYFLMMAYSFAASASHTLMMHASVIESDGKGMLFLGKSGTGKSTHSRLWLDHVPNASLLNDDNPVVRMLPNGDIRVFGSPWSGKTPCYRNHSVKISAFVRLKQAPENRLVRLPASHAFAALLPSCSNMVWDKQVHDDTCQTIALIAAKSKVAQLECLPDRSAVELSYSLL